MENTLENINYLINELEKGRNLNILFISHNAYWSQLEKLKNKYKNCKVEVAGETGFFAWKRELDSYDIIYYNSSYDFGEEYLSKLENIATSISEKESKRVSILYSYMSKKDGKVTDEMKIVSFKDNIKHEETIKFNRYYTSPLALTGLVLKTADELDSQKTKVKQDQ